MRPEPWFPELCPRVNAEGANWGERSSPERIPGNGGTRAFWLQSAVYCVFDLAKGLPWSAKLSCSVAPANSARQAKRGTLPAVIMLKKTKKNKENYLKKWNVAGQKKVRNATNTWLQCDFDKTLVETARFRLVTSDWKSFLECRTKFKSESVSG